MDTEDFDELASRAPENIRLEFINGRIGVKPVPDGDHDEIIRWVMERCLQHRPDLWLYPERGIKVEAYRAGRSRPDGVLAPRDTFAGQGEWAEAAGVLMVVEVTSHDSDTNQRDRIDKPGAYAQAGIPVFLLIDRDSCDVTVFSEPADGRYGSRVTVAFGHEVTLPGLGIVLDTEALQAYVR
jgi:Uma2 family endonuclease